MKKKIILIIGILIALVAIWQSVKGAPLINKAIHNNSLICQGKSIIHSWLE